MNKDTFNMIRRALHPDSRNSISDKKLGEAFAAFMALKFEKDSFADISEPPENRFDEAADIEEALAAVRKAQTEAPVRRPGAAERAREMQMRWEKQQAKQQAEQQARLRELKKRPRRPYYVRRAAVERVIREHWEKVGRS
jgi:hypothetical protein